MNYMLHLWWQPLKLSTLFALSTFLHWSHELWSQPFICLNVSNSWLFRFRFIFGRIDVLMHSLLTIVYSVKMHTYTHALITHTLEHCICEMECCLWPIVKLKADWISYVSPPTDVTMQRIKLMIRTCDSGYTCFHWLWITLTICSLLALSWWANNVNSLIKVPRWISSLNLPNCNTSNLHLK